MEIITHLMQYIKMNKLQYHNTSEQEYWHLINQLNWYGLTLTNESEDAVELLGSKLSLMFTSVQDIFAFQNFVVNKRIELQSFIEGYCTGKNDGELFDDANSLWDLSAHIVGLGKVMFDYVKKQPSLLKLLQNDVVENFEYGFDKAIEIMTENTD